MKQLTIIFVLIFSVFVLRAQIIINPDGTHGIIAGQHVHNSDGTLSVIHGNHLIHQSGKISVIYGSHIADQNGRISSLTNANEPMSDIFSSNDGKRRSKEARNLAFKRNAQQIDKLDAQKKTRRQERRLKGKRQRSAIKKEDSTSLLIHQGPAIP